MLQKYRDWLRSLNRSELSKPPEPSSPTIESREEILLSILYDLLPEEPFVFQGKFSWFRLDNEAPRSISVIFLEIDLAIQVHPPGVIPPRVNAGRPAEITAASTDQEAAEALREALKEDGIGLIEIYWDAEISRSQMERCFKQLQIDLG